MPRSALSIASMLYTLLVPAALAAAGEARVTLFFGSRGMGVSPMQAALAEADLQRGPDGRATERAPKISATPADRPPADLGARVSEIFAAKCAQCHMAGMARPKGKFGYVLDLPRIAANPRLIVRSDPAHSKLWQEIDEGDMPPDDAKAGPLSDSEKQGIRSWIEAGAPAPTLAVQQVAVSETVTQPAFPPVSRGHGPSVARRVLRLIGKFHVLVIHFPIGLIAAAAAVESWRMLRRHQDISPIVRFCVYFGAAGAVVAAVLGWVHAPFSGYDANAAGTLLLHRWAGVAAAMAAVVAATLSELDNLRGRRSLTCRFALFGAALLIGAAGHLGGTLVYGADFFHW